MKKSNTKVVDEMTVEHFNRLPKFIQGGYYISMIKETGMTVEQYWLRKQLAKCGKKLVENSCK